MQSIYQMEQVSTHLSSSPAAGVYVADTPSSPSPAHVQTTAAPLSWESYISTPEPTQPHAISLFPLLALLDFKHHCEK